MTKRWTSALTAGMAALSLAALGACGSPGASSPGAPADTAAAGSTGGAAGGAPYKVGLVYSKTGALAAYGTQYETSFKVGLDYATKGTGAVNGHPVQVSEADDAGDPAKAVQAVTAAIGDGAKIIAGSTASGVALQVAPLAKDNKVLFISGPPPPTRSPGPTSTPSGPAVRPTRTSRPPARSSATSPARR
jgi:branched-chain amino acid transport system substrate-binding protein